MKATIMIPAYNVERFLPQTLESALEQTYRGDYEVLVVNDGSTDDTLRMLDFYKGQHEKLKVLNQRNKGVGAARGRLLEESKGEILLCLDADDRLYPEALERVNSYFEEHPEKIFVYTDHEEIDEAGRRVRVRRKQKLHSLFNEIILHCHFPGHLRAFRKSGLEGSRFDPELKVSEDYDFLLNVIMKTWPDLQIGHIPEVLYSYRITNSGLSRTQTQKQNFIAKKIIEKHLRENEIYGDKEFEIVPVTLDNLVFWDHLVDGRFVMNPEARGALERYLRERGLREK